jgi:hypothetical protein
MNRILTFTAVIILLVVGSLFAKTVEVSVSRVAVISPGENEEDLTLGPRVCLSFTLPQSVQGQEIGRAELVMMMGQINDVPEDSILVFEAYLLTSNWSENIGWDGFSTPGGDIDSSYYVAGSVKLSNDGEMSLDISEMTRSWNSARRDNYGLILIPRNTEFNSFRAFPYSAGQLRNRVSMKIIVPGRDE